MDAIAQIACPKLEKVHLINYSIGQNKDWPLRVKDSFFCKKFCLQHRLILNVKSDGFWLEGTIHRTVLVPGHQSPSVIILQSYLVTSLIKVLCWFCWPYETTACGNACDPPPLFLIYMLFLNLNCSDLK